MFVLPNCAQLFLHEGGDIEVIIIVAHDAVVFDKGGSLYLFAQIIGYGIRYKDEVIERKEGKTAGK